MQLKLLATVVAGSAVFSPFLPARAQTPGNVPLSSQAAPVLQQPAPLPETLQTLRGFRVGASCMNLEAAYEAVRREGFTASSPGFACAYRAGEYHVDFLMRHADGQDELIELFFTSDSHLWRVRVNRTWDGLHRLDVRPTPQQVRASLIARFGPPYAAARDRAVSGQPESVRDEAKDVRAGEHGLAFSWGTTLYGEGPGPDEVDGWTWSRWTSDLVGIATEANLVWNDDSPAVTLVVDMLDRAKLPVAALAQKETAAARAAIQARRDGTMLKGL